MVVLKLKEWILAFGFPLPTLLAEGINKPSAVGMFGNDERSLSLYFARVKIKLLKKPR